jgi:serine/threonine-protein kinase PRP4
MCKIVLGLPYNEAIDMWSVGCVLYELYTGKILFTGRDNNGMLFQCQEIGGPFPKKMLKKAKFKNDHFDGNFDFEHRIFDKVSGQVMIVSR